MRNLKRALSLALATVMTMGLMVVGTGASYKDVKADHNVEAIEVLQAAGIMTGDENGNFNPDAKVTRNEMAVVMSNLMAYNVKTYSGTSPFTDVPSWAEAYVAACYTNGITAGSSATTYGGDRSVTTAEAALMVMKALGYFQYQSDFGDDWQLSTVAQGNKIDLFTDVKSGVKEAMTRNDLAQLVLNGLEAGTVEAETNGSITVGDTTIVSGVKYNFITSGQSYARAINNALYTNNDATTSTGSIVELGEKLYQGDLMKKGGSDDFGRPSNIWSYNNKEIGTYADEADYTYTEAISEKDLYNELGATVVGYTWDVYYNGESQGSVKPAKADTDDYADTATGTLTEVFVDSVNKHVTVTMMDTFLAEVVRVSDDKKTVTVNYLGDQMANTSGRQTSYEVESTDLVEGDKVLVTLFQDGAQFSIASMVKAETVTGEVTAVKARYTDGKGKYAVMNETKYNYVGNTFAEDLADTDLVDPTLNKENTLYLDTYGNMIAFEATERAVDYLYMKDSINDLNGIKALATFADGSSETISINKLTKLGGTVIKGTALGVTDLVATSGVYSYVKQGSTYEITELKDANTTANSWSSAPAAAGNYDNGATVSPNTYTIKKGLNAIQFNNGVTTQNIVSLNNSTIFVDVEGGVIYTGYVNVPTMTDISFYVVYNKQLNADVVFITDGADNSTSDSYFMILDKDPVASKKAADGTMYYEYKASVNGEETTLTMKGINKDNAGNAFAKHALYKIETITPNDEITEAEKVTAFSTTFSASGSYATEKTSGTIRIANDANIAQCGNNLVSGLGEDIYAYNNDTIFMNVELKANGDVSKVSRSSANAINTYNDDIPGYSNVYVVTVDDKDARTPVATLVYVVTPHESTSGGSGTGTGTLGSVTVNADLTVTMDAVVNTADATVRAEMKQAIEQIAGKTVVRVDNGTPGNDKSVFTFTCSDGTVYTGTVTYKHTITIDGTVHYLNAASGSTTSIPAASVNAAFDMSTYASNGGTGYAYSKDNGTTWTYVAYATDLDSASSAQNLTSTRGNAQNLIVKTNQVALAVSGGATAPVTAGQSATAPAKGSDHGTGFKYTVGGVDKFVAYGGTIPAADLNDDLTLTKNQIQVISTGFVTAADNKTTIQAYDTNYTVPSKSTDAGTGVKVSGMSGTAYAAYAGSLSLSGTGSETDITVEAGYVKVTIGGTVTAHKAGTAYGVFAKGASNRGTGVEVAVTSGSKYYVAYGDTFAASYVTNDLTINADMVKVIVTVTNAPNETYNIAPASGGGASLTAAGETYAKAATSNSIVITPGSSGTDLFIKTTGTSSDSAGTSDTASMLNLTTVDSDVTITINNVTF